MALGKRIAERLAQLEKSQTWLAERSGVDEGTISALITRDSQRSQFAPALATALDVDILWLLTGEQVSGSLKLGAAGPVIGLPSNLYSRSGVEQDRAEYADEIVLIPFIDAQVGAGPGVQNGDERTLDLHKYSRTWIERNGLHAPALRRVKVTGDSMRPTIFDGDVALVNTAERKITNGKVFAFIVDGEARVKRLFKQFDGRIRVVSDNPDKLQFPDEFLTPDHMPEMVGRVVDRSGKADL